MQYTVTRQRRVSNHYVVLQAILYFGKSNFLFDEHFYYAIRAKQTVETKFDGDTSSVYKHGIKLKKA